MNEPRTNRCWPEDFWFVPEQTRDFPAGAVARAAKMHPIRASLLTNRSRPLRIPEQRSGPMRRAVNLEIRRGTNTARIADTLIFSLCSRPWTPAMVSGIAAAYQIVPPRGRNHRVGASGIYRSVPNQDGRQLRPNRRPQAWRARARAEPADIRACPPAARRCSSNRRSTTSTGHNNPLTGSR
jgi:hypothetical protein